MLQSEVFPLYRKYRDELAEVYEFMKTQYQEGYAEELCKLRLYVGEDQRNLIKDMQIGIADLAGDLFKGYSEELGLLSKTGNFLLSNRYVVPIYMPNGDLVSLVGYYPDTRKYVTLPTPFFSKACIFFNFKQAYDLSWSEYDGFVILVEGIFDCLSLRSIGLPAIATMGASVSYEKGELLKLFSRVIAIPDDDNVGRSALDRRSKRGWKVPDNTTMIKFTGGEIDFGDVVLRVKDMDNFVSWYDKNDVRELLLSYRGSKNEVEELIL